MHHHLTVVQITMPVILVVNIDIAREPTQIFGRLHGDPILCTYIHKPHTGTEKVYQVVHGCKY